MLRNMGDILNMNISAKLGRMYAAPISACLRRREDMRFPADRDVLIRFTSEC